MQKKKQNKNKQTNKQTSKQTKTKPKQITNKCLNICEQVEVAERNRDNHLPFSAALWHVSVCEKTDNVKLLLILVSEYTKLLIFCFVFVCVIFNSPCNLGLLQEFWKTFIMNMTWISFIVPLWVIISIENGSKEEQFLWYFVNILAFHLLLTL